MTPAPRRRRAAPPPDPFPERGLAELGLAPGDQVRFRRNDTERWKPATVARRERDGSVGLHDPKGASRAIPIGCIEVRDTGPRGGTVWEPLTERAARTEQMALVATTESREPSPPSRRPAPATDATDVPPAPEPDVDDDHDDGQLRLL